MNVAITTQLPPEAICSIIVALLDTQLSEFCGGVDVDSIGEKDIDEQGDLTMVPPAARVLFLDKRYSEPTETQSRSYNATLAIAILCIAGDLRSVTAQRDATMRLASEIEYLLVGARLALGDGVTTTEPIVAAGVLPIPAGDKGMGYAVNVLVPGVAQFAAPNAYPAAPQGDE